MPSTPLTLATLSWISMTADEAVRTFTVCTPGSGPSAPLDLHALYQLTEREQTRLCTRGSGRDPQQRTRLCGPSLCALLGLVHQLHWLGFCVYSRVWSIGSIGWGSVCTPGSGPSALLAGVLCALPGLVHQLYWRDPDQQQTRLILSMTTTSGKMQARSLEHIKIYHSMVVNLHTVYSNLPALRQCSKPITSCTQKPLYTESMHS